MVRFFILAQPITIVRSRLAELCSMLLLWLLLLVWSPLIRVETSRWFITWFLRAMVVRAMMMRSMMMWAVMMWAMMMRAMMVRTRWLNVLWGVLRLVLMLRAVEKCSLGLCIRLTIVLICVRCIKRMVFLQTLCFPMLDTTVEGALTIIRRWVASVLALVVHLWMVVALVVVRLGLVVVAPVVAPGRRLVVVRTVVTRSIIVAWGEVRPTITIRKLIISVLVPTWLTSIIVGSAVVHGASLSVDGPVPVPPMVIVSVARSRPWPIVVLALWRAAGGLLVALPATAATAVAHFVVVVRFIQTHRLFLRWLAWV